MPTKSQTKSHPLLADRDDAIRAWESVDTDHADKSANQRAGVRAALTRKVADLELELTIAGVDGWEPWSAPRKTSPRRSKSSADLFTRLEVVEAIRDDATKPEAIRATASRHADQIRRSLIARGELPDAKPATDAKPAKRTRKPATGHKNPAQAMDAIEQAVKTAA
jgi:hypothetical protein